MIKLFSARISELEQLIDRMRNDFRPNQFPVSAQNHARRVDFVVELLEINNKLLVKAHCIIEKKSDRFEPRSYQ